MIASSTTGKALTAATIGAMALATASPAMADGWRGGYYRHGGGDSTGAAIAGGIVGLAVGAAIASSDRPRVVYRERYYEPDYYYAPRAYYPAPVYYPAPAYYPRAYYPRGYYAREYYGHPYYGRPWRHGW